MENLGLWGLMAFVLQEMEYPHSVILEHQLSHTYSLCWSHFGDLPISLQGRLGQMSLLDHDQHLVSDGASLRLMHKITRVSPEWLIKGGQPYLFIKQPAEQVAMSLMVDKLDPAAWPASWWHHRRCFFVCVLRCGFFIWHPYSVVRTVYPWIVAGFSMFSCLCHVPLPRTRGVVVHLENSFLGILV